MTSAKLILIPTPIDEISPLETMAKERLLKAVGEERAYSLILVEDLKPARQRWLRFGLPREAIEHFIPFNEHTRQEQFPLIQKALKEGKQIYLMSDGGVPCFCDPGVELVNYCHQQKIKVTATPLPNSLILALILSGFICDQFVFAGFLPREQKERQEQLNFMAQEKRVQIIMDTPYRLEKLVSEINSHPELGRREIFLSLNLGHPDELLLRGRPGQIIQEISGLKAEFVLVLSGASINQKNL